MEYHFQNGPQENLLKATLNEFEITIEVAQATKRIPYASITEVRLGRRKDAYFTQVISLDYGTLYLSNKTFKEDNWIDQSRRYHTFIRVLHLHLSSKSKASFYSGTNLGKQAVKLLLLFICTALLFLSEEYFDWVPFSTLAVSSIFFVAGLAIIIIPGISQWPKSYEPTEIPMELLPPT